MSFLRFQFSTDLLSFFPCVLAASVDVSKARSRTVLPMGNVNENCRGRNVTSNEYFSDSLTHISAP